MSGKGIPIVGPGELDRRVIAVAPGDVSPEQRGEFNALVYRLGQLAPPLIVEPNLDEPAAGLRAYDPETQDTLGTLEREQAMDLFGRAGMPEDEQTNTWNILKLASARVAQKIETWEAHDTIRRETELVKGAIADRQEGGLTAEDFHEVLSEEGLVISRARETVVEAAQRHSLIPVQRPEQEPFMFVWDEAAGERRRLMPDDVSEADPDIILDVGGLYFNLAHAGGHRELSDERLGYVVAAVNGVIEDRIGPEPEIPGRAAA